MKSIFRSAAIGIRVALAGRQNDPAPQGDLLRRPMCRQPLLDLLVLGQQHDQGRFGALRRFVLKSSTSYMPSVRNSMVQAR